MEIKRIFKIALALMFGGVIITGIFTLNQEGFQPSATQLENQINQDIGTTTVHIGAQPDTSRKKSREQMEALIAWNSLAASNCEVLAASHVMSGIQIGQRLSENEIDPSEKPLVFSQDKEKRNADGWLNGYEWYNESSEQNEEVSKIVDNRRNGIFGFDAGYRPLLETGFDKECIGSESVIQEVEDVIKESSGTLLSKAGPMIAVGGAALAIGACTIGTAGICGAAAVGIIGGGSAVAIGVAGTAAGTAAYLHGQNMIPPDRNLKNEVGFDMEGKFGRIDFTVNKTFHMGTDYPNPIIGMNFKSGDWKGNGAPGFWRGKRFMYAVPPGLVPQDTDGSACCSLEPPSESAWDGGPFDGENNYKNKWGSANSRVKTLYSWRVRMINEENLEDDDISAYNIPLAGTISQSDVNNKDPDVNIIRTLLEETEWVICKGAEGYVQSNAKDLHTDGEIQADNSEKEDNVYPMIRISEGALDCLEPEGAEQDLSDVDSVRGSLDTVDDLENEFYDVWNEDFPEFLECNDKRDLGKIDTVFSRELFQGGTFQTRFMCGGEQHAIEIDPGEGEYGGGSEYGGSLGSAKDWIWYYEPKFKIDGCSSVHYGITGETEDTSDSNLVWNHDPMKNYLSGGERKDQIVHEALKIDHRREVNSNKTYEVNISYSGGDNLKAVISEEAAGSNMKYKTAIYREGTLIEEAEEEAENYQRFILNFDRNNLEFKSKNAVYSNEDAGNIVINNLGEEIDEKMPGNDIERITIGNVTSQRLEEVNEDTSGFEFSQNQGGLSMENVVALGQPKVCHKGFR